ncbi:MAG: hypothetical protein WA966_04105 [Ornithinimicrobium sp.]
MNLADAMALIVPPVNDLKRRALSRADGETTMFPTLVVLRGDRVLAAVTTPRAEATLGCAHTVAVGLAPQMLAFAAQVTLPDGAEALAYTTMTSEHRAALAVQRYAVTPPAAEGSTAQITFDIPERGDPSDRTLMDELAKAMTHAPLDPTKVSSSGSVPADESADAPEPQFISRERGRMVLDSGTCASLERSVSGIAGTVLYVASSDEHAQELKAHGMPPGVLVTGSGAPPSA